MARLYIFYIITILFLHNLFLIFLSVGHPQFHEVHSGVEAWNVDCCLLRRFRKRLYQAAVDIVNLNRLAVYIRRQLYVKIVFCRVRITEIRPCDAFSLIDRIIAIGVKFMNVWIKIVITFTLWKNAVYYTSSIFCCLDEVYILEILVFVNISSPNKIKFAVKFADC